MSALLRECDEQWERAMEAWRAWDALSTALSSGEMPPLEWAMRWASDGSLETLWRQTSGSDVHRILQFVDPNALVRAERFWSRHRRHRTRDREFEYLRRTTPAPTFAQLVARRLALAEAFEIPF